ncbi:MAG: PAS domain-containing protein [Alphaproteobacteria bacterium]|nr:PAS domain-containing protein [Alphaproteobacteria bacterium]
MRASLRDEIIEAGSADTDADVPRLKRGLKLGKIVLILSGVVLCGIALWGLKELVETFSSGEPKSAEHLFLTVDFLVIPLLLLGILLGAGARYFDRLNLAISYQERLNKLQNRLNYREDLLRLIADHRAGPIAIFDHQNHYWYVNQPSADAIGKSPMEVIGKPVSRILGQEKARQLELRLAEARAAGGTMEKVDRIVDEKGQTRFIQSRYISISPIAELSGGVLINEEDLTNLIVERERRERMLKQVIETLVAVVDRRDPYAAGHSSRVGQLARAIAKEMDIEPKLIDTAEIAGSLMNFGKVLVSRNILTKTTALSPEELQRVRDSILVSADILAIIGFEGPVVPTLRQVLERFDGSGVPEGLRGEDIMVTARIVAVANAFVALVSPRAHRDSLPFAAALEGMMAEADKIYDRRVLIALSNYMENRANKLDWLMTAKQA